MHTLLHFINQLHPVSATVNGVKILTSKEQIFQTPVWEFNNQELQMFQQLERWVAFKSAIHSCTGI